jgi:hypothetical protein
MGLHSRAGSPGRRPIRSRSRGGRRNSRSGGKSGLVNLLHSPDTAIRQQKGAAASESYDGALQSYNSAQRALAVGTQRRRERAPNC